MSLGRSPWQPSMTTHFSLHWIFDIVLQNCFTDTAVRFKASGLPAFVSLKQK